MLRGVKRAMDGMKRESVREILEALDVEELNRGRHGIRTSVLREAGINNLWQVHGMSLPQLVRINGIGDQGAQKIKEIADEFAASAQQSARIRLRADDTSRAQQTLVDGLYRYIHTQEPRETARRLVESEGARIDAALKEAAPLAGGLSRLFAFGRRRTQAQTAADYLAGLCSGEFSRLAQDAIGRSEAAGKAS